MNQEIVNEISELFYAWYRRIMFSSIWDPACKEKDELLSYCKEHIDEFKEFAKTTLENPKEYNYMVANLCDELLPDVFEFAEVNFENEKSNQSILKIIEEASKQIYKKEYSIWSSPNRWLNYLKGTKGVDYYKDFVDYKEYLNKHYISWKPNEEDDPNPTYKEFVEHRKKYKI